MLKGRLLAGLITVLLAAASSGAVFGQSYEWRDIVQDVTLKANGSVVVNDTRTLWTSSTFGEAFICVGHGGGVTVTLMQGSGALGTGPSTYSYSQPCVGGIEVVVHNNSRLSERRVRFVYRLDGTMDAYSDVVQWCWNLVQLDHPVILGYQLTVHTPGPMAAPFNAYVHRNSNPEQPSVTLSPDRSQLDVAFDRIPPGDGVEIRYLMDPALFALTGSSPGLEQLLQDESRVAGLQAEYQQRPAFFSRVFFFMLHWLAGFFF